MSKARLMYLAVVASLFAGHVGVFLKAHALPFLPDGMGDGHL
jgi:hypothetical protein